MRISLGDYWLIEQQTLSTIVIHKKCIEDKENYQRFGSDRG